MISTRMTMVRNHVAPQVVSSTNSVIVDNNIIVSPYSTERFSAYLLDQNGDPMPSMPTGDWRWGYTYAAPYPHGSTTWTTYNPTYDPATGLYSADADIASLAVNYYELIVELQRFIPSYDSNMQIVASMPIEHYTDTPSMDHSAVITLTNPVNDVYDVGQKVYYDISFKDVNNRNMLDEPGAFFDDSELSEITNRTWNQANSSMRVESTISGIKGGMSQMKYRTVGIPERTGSDIMSPTFVQLAGPAVMIRQDLSYLGIASTWGGDTVYRYFNTASLEVGDWAIISVARPVNGTNPTQSMANPDIIGGTWSLEHETNGPSSNSQKTNQLSVGIATYTGGPTFGIKANQAHARYGAAWTAYIFRGGYKTISDKTHFDWQGGRSNRNAPGAAGRYMMASMAVDEDSSSRVVAPPNGNTSDRLSTSHKYGNSNDIRISTTGAHAYLSNSTGIQAWSLSGNVNSASDWNQMLVFSYR